MKKRTISFVISLILLTGATGCNLLEWPVYVLFGQKTEKVQAEYEGLAGGRPAAIIIATEPGVDFDYPEARTNIALALAAAIKSHVKDITFVDQQDVERFQMENLNWATLPMTDIAQKFSATRLIYLDLYQFTMQEENSLHLLRGNIRAALWIYEADGVSPNRPAYSTEITVLYPEHAPIPASQAAAQDVENKSIAEFAQKTALKFYDHKVALR
ncbi:MAG: hypothetical protein JW860_04750 [Sedimentisphaerales bacterium]|nr:hypothetical protein [Sedimentisphaerales bacterium]